MNEIRHGARRPKPANSSELHRIEHAKVKSELDGFAYIVSHDLRNSARALSEVPLWLREDLEAQGVSFNRDIQENFDLIERHAKRLDRMLLDLLTYSRVGRLQSIRCFSLFDLLDEVGREINLTERVDVICEADMPDLVMGYQDAFVMVRSLLDNVMRHCAGDNVTLSIHACRCKNEVTLTFTDNGPGISEGDLQRAFRPMTTLARRDEVEGSGMGLAIVQRIAHHYGGDLWAGAGPDGTGLCIRLRLRDSVGDSSAVDCPMSSMDSAQADDSKRAF